MATPQDKIDLVIKLRQEGYTQRDISKSVDLPQSTVSNIISRNKTNNPDQDIIDENVALSKRLIKLQDSSNIKNKSFREFARADNMLVALHKSLDEKLAKFNMSASTQPRIASDISKPIGVIQLSDLHFGEVVTGLQGNSFDFKIASQRIHKLIEKSIEAFKGRGITDVAVFMTGDLINSSRRISEITEFSAARTNVVILAMDIIQQAIIHLNKHFNVTVATVVGNESRTTDYFDTTDFLASDNYDLMLHNLLKRLFVGSESVKFLDTDNPMEKVVDLQGTNFLLVHGNVHRGLAVTKNIEVEVEKIKARYAAGGVRIDYVICGHIHQTYISNQYSRSASLVGSNQYSERSLNLVSKASQNIYFVDKDGIDAMMVDLQNASKYDGYAFDRNMIRYFSSGEPKSTVVIQSVLI